MKASQTLHANCWHALMTIDCYTRTVRTIIYLLPCLNASSAVAAFSLLVPVCDTIVRLCASLGCCLVVLSNWLVGCASIECTKCFVPTVVCLDCADLCAFSILSRSQFSSGYGDTYCVPRQRITLHSAHVHGWCTFSLGRVSDTHARMNFC